MTKPNVMTHSQRQYAVARVEKVAKELELQAKKKYPDPELTFGELMKLIKGGKLKAKVGNDYDISRYTDVSSIFDINRLVDEANPKFLEADKKIEKELQRVKDSIMLGDNDEALKAIAAFEAFKL